MVFLDKYYLQEVEKMVGQWLAFFLYRLERNQHQRRRWLADGWLKQHKFSIVVFELDEKLWLDLEWLAKGGLPISLLKVTV